MPETFLYLTSIGRKTGNSHKIEIWFVEHESCHFLCSEYPKKSDWVQNCLKTAQVSFYIAEKSQDAPAQKGRASIIEDETIIAILKQKFDAKYNWSDGLFFKICLA
jgi:F420H(2)-dependent quinone reductase